MPYDHEEDRRRQRLAGKLLDREPLRNMSDWVAFAVEVHYNLGECRDGGCPVDVEEIPSLETCEECDGEGCEECEYEGGVLVEIYEWYAVTRWLGRQLAERGETVLSGEYWGRRTTGQAVMLDEVIQDIAVQYIRDEGSP